MDIDSVARLRIKFEGVTLSLKDFGMRLSDKHKHGSKDK